MLKTEVCSTFSDIRIFQDAQIDGLTPRYTFTDMTTDDCKEKLQMQTYRHFGANFVPSSSTQGDCYIYSSNVDEMPKNITLTFQKDATVIAKGIHEGNAFQRFFRIT